MPFAAINKSQGEIFTKYKIICDFCENFETKTEQGHINDHQTKETFDEIFLAMKRLGYDCEIYGGVPELLKAYQSSTEFDSNTIFLNLSDGTDKKYSRVQVPVICDLLNVKYSGGGTFETALTSNKYYSTLAVKKRGLLSPDNMLVTKDTIFSFPEGKFIIKPNAEGSSIGITDKSVCHTPEEISNQVQVLLTQFDEVLVEEYIPGYDVTCFVIGNEEIMLNEILLIKHHDKMIFNNEVLCYTNHLHETRKFVINNGILPSDTEKQIKEISIKIKKIFGINDFCRIDYRITENKKIYFLEINTVPAISMKSQVGVICEHLKITFDTFIDYIVKTVTNRFNHE